MAHLVKAAHMQSYRVSRGHAALQADPCEATESRLKPSRTCIKVIGISQPQLLAGIHTHQSAHFKVQPHRSPVHCAASPTLTRQSSAAAPSAPMATTPSARACQLPAALKRFTHRSSRYPAIDVHFEGLEMVHEEPPVFVVHGMLSDEECDSLKALAQGGELIEVPCGDAVMLDPRRLTPLAALLPIGAAPTIAHAVAAGTPPVGVAAAAAGATAVCTAVAAGLTVAVKWAMHHWIQGKVFTGTKWRTDHLRPSHPAWPAYHAFVTRTSSLLRTLPAHLEPPTIVHYGPGQQQRVHIDCRAAEDTVSTAHAGESLAAAGQRLAQCLVYLHSMDPMQGGGTKFHAPELAGLTVRPEKGKALIFFPAFRDGSVDFRMPHSGEAVLSGDKWIINTWACQCKLPRPMPRLLT